MDHLQINYLKEEIVSIVKAPSSSRLIKNLL